MSRFFSILLILFYFKSFGQNPSDSRLAGLDAFVHTVLTDYKAPGVTIAVVEKGKIIYTGGFGYRDKEKKLPVTENTLFAIGSCTKAFTATLLGGLVEQGSLDLDKPVRNYLPELKFINDILNTYVTTRDMMTHRTGLPRHDLSWYGSNASRMELVKRIEYMEPTATLREKYQYNNFMFLSQGVLVEKLTGKSWESNIKEKIFTPLGMQATCTTIAEMEKSSDRMPAYSLINDSFALPIPYRVIDAMGPAGSINSNAKDMAKWLLAWINSGKYNGQQIIPTNFRSQAMTIQMASGGVPSNENSDVHNFGYGLAWTVGNYRGHYRVEHGGGIDGFITTTCFFPSDSLGIFVSSATGNISSPIRNWIADKMLSLPYRDWHKQMRDAFVKARFGALMSPKNNEDPNTVKNTKPSLALNDYSGTYLHKGYGLVTVKLGNSGLEVEFNGSTIKLNHKHFDVFSGRPEGAQYETAEKTDVFFQMNKLGKIDRLSVAFQPGLPDIVFMKEPSVKLSGQDLTKYVGEYTLGPQPVSFIVRQGALFALLPPQPDYELVPSGMDEFKLKILEGYSVKFKTDATGKYIEAAFIQPNGTFVAKRK